MIAGGNRIASNYKYFACGGGLIYTSDSWGRFQPFFKREAGYASLTHPSNFSSHLHDTRNIWTLRGGVEYHTWGQLWTRVEYSYDFFPDFHSSNTTEPHPESARHNLWRDVLFFGPSGSRF